MKVIIAGGREFNDYNALKVYCDGILQNQSEVEIVSGRCVTGVPTFTTQEGYKVCGADGLGEKYAKEKGYAVKPFPADWGKFKKSAGFIRNGEMAKYADALIAFWDGKSRGTGHMINLAKERGLKIRIYRYQK
jgi:hypothetical protein